MRYHETYYRPNNAFLVVVCSQAPEAVFVAAEKAFGGWARGDVPAVRAPALPTIKGRHLVFVIQNATQAGFASTLNMVHTNGLAPDCPETCQRQISQPSGEMVKTGARMLLGSDDSLVVIVGDYRQVKDQLTGFANISFLDISGNPIPEPQ